MVWRVYSNTAGSYRVARWPIPKYMGKHTDSYIELAHVCTRELLTIVAVQSKLSQPACEPQAHICMDSYMGNENTSQELQSN
jgi:hypothetical protein